MRKIFAHFILVSLFSFFVSGCGFTPLYGKHGADSPAVQEKFQQVAIASIPERSGQILRNNLVDRLYRDGMPADPRYVLHVAAIQQRLTDLDITPDSTATRAEMRLVTTMTLTERASGAALLKRDLIAITSYNILGSQYTTLVSQQNVRENALNDLAQQIETHLALYFKRAP